MTIDLNTLGTHLTTLGTLIVAGVPVVLLILSLRRLLRLRSSKSRGIEAPPPVEARCGNCKHWDLEEGQAVMASQPHFMMAARVVPPAEMGRRATNIGKKPCTECDGGEIHTGRYRTDIHPIGEVIIKCEVCDGTGEVDLQEMSAPSAPYKASWGQFGACGNEKCVDADGAGACTWRGDICEHWESKLIGAGELTRERAS